MVVLLAGLSPSVPPSVATLNPALHTPGAWVAEEVELAFGGVAPKAIMAPKTEQALQGKAWEQPLLQAALQTLAEDVNITANAPGAWHETHSDSIHCTSADMAVSCTRVQRAATSDMLAMRSPK